MRAIGNVPDQRGRLRPSAAGVAVLLVALFLTACSSSGEPTEDAVDTDRLTKQIDTYLDSRDEVRAVSVSAGGETVVEIYRDADPEDYWDVESVTKSVISILVGIALDEGHLAGTDQTLAELLPSHTAQMSSQVAGVTLHQLLTMTAGFSGIVDDQGAFIDRTPQYMSANDPVGRILGTAQENPAGFDYSNGGGHLVSAILREATGMSVLEYARSRLFEPLGISSEPAHEPLGVGVGADEPLNPLWAMPPEYVKAYLEAGFAWPVDPAGIHLGWGLLKLTPADLAKIGVLMADQGRWKGKQVVSEEWVRSSTTAQVTVGEDDFGAGGTGYGYLWWAGTADAERAYFAAGYGGQLLVVVPARDLVVVIATEFDLASPSYQDISPAQLLPLVDDVITPAFPNQ